MTHNPQVAEKLKQMEERFKERLALSVEQIRSLDQTGRIDELIRICHQLAGTSGTFGYHNLSIEMKEFEQVLISFRDNESMESFSKQIEKACEIIERALKA